MYKKITKSNMKQNNGITLIALVVTIVILLILANVAILLLNGENGIMTNAKKAKENSTISEEEETIKLAFSAAFTSSEGAHVTSGALRKELQKQEKDVTVVVAQSNSTDKNGARGRGIKVVYNKTGNIYFVDKDGNIIENGCYEQGPTAVYWIVYSNNSDDSDLELVFNSTGNVDSNRKLVEKGKDISKTSFEKIDDVPYYKYAGKIKQVTIENEIAPQYTKRWFDRLTNLIKINNIENLYTNNVVDMSTMFQSCFQLESIDVSNFDTSKVTNMSGMFNGGNKSKIMKLKITGLESFDTRNVTNMYAMFYTCSGLANLDLSGWDTRKVTNMYYMFYNCSNLSNLDVSNFDTSNVTNMRGIFCNCFKLSNLNLSSFDTSNVTDMRFYVCEYQ